MGLEWLDTLQSHFSRLSGRYALTGLAHSLQSFIWGVWKSTGLTKSLQSCIRGGMGVNWLDTVTPVLYLGGGEVWDLNGLTQSLQSFVWEVCVDWLGTVTAVVYLGWYAVDWLDSHFSRLYGGMGVGWLDTVTSVVYLGGGGGGMGVD